MAKAEFSPPLSTDPQEACGITAVFSKQGEPLSLTIPIMQHELHHRGRDSAGMAVYHENNDSLAIFTDVGSVKHVFQIDTTNGESTTEFPFVGHDLVSDRGIGHNRYGTSGNEEKDSPQGSQPMQATWEGRSVAIAFNGNIPEAERAILRSRIPDAMPETGDFDTNDIVRSIAASPGITWEEKIRSGMQDVQGAYSLNILTDTGEVYGLRGPSGTWPLWIGESSDRIVFASESVVDDDPALQWSSVKPGELVQATHNGVVRTQLFQPLAEIARCSLHDFYGARPESLMYQDKTHEDFREAQGRQLALEHPLEADVYIGVPNSGRQIAKGYAEELGVVLTDALQLYEGSERSYIAQNVETSVAIVHGKYKPMDPEFIRGKSVVFIEDSVIKGSTTGGYPTAEKTGIIQMARDAGATTVTIVSGMGEFTDDCDQGYVVKKQLHVALKREAENSYRKLSNQEIADRLGADAIHYMSIDGLKKVYNEFFSGEENACFACMGEPHPFHGYTAKPTRELVQSY